ncbi:hypothetical protein Xen7305DRAFT_00026220 [Xenococcus sp. PCC 7305]|uniref:hypothetical protein n=1 Tax=Xenococcus sp. PCC 7305 TaxID=102125 RepID=UPI0002ABC471|nr:hypothetical protein [Xenococcus sp. PCC 7305]ELS02904.1 hypothetical protein Xen7305DRAFT_00026220 [Xenococcus sp. PCC 7305]
MIKFIKISEANLKFTSYPNLKLVSDFLCLVFLITWLIWCVYFSYIDSSLICHKTTFNHVDCVLQESSLINHHLTQTSINNLRKANKSLFSKSSVIALQTNPNFPYFKIIGFQKTYYYPSSSFALVNFKYILPQNWFKPSQQLAKINQFIKGELKNKFLAVERSLNWIELLILGFFTLFIPLLLIFSIIKGVVTMPMKTIYEFDGINKTLLVSQSKIFKPNIIKEYGFDQINQIRLETDDSKNIINGYIILQFNPDYDYPIGEFINVEYGQQKFQIIQEFITRYK